MKKKALFLVYAWPSESQSAAGLRTKNIIKTLLSQNYEVTAGGISKLNSASEDLSSLGVHILTLAANTSDLENFLTKNSFELIFFDRFVLFEQFAWKAKKVSPESLFILDTQDLHCLRISRQLCHQKNIPWEPDWLWPDKLKEEKHPDLCAEIKKIVIREVCCIYQADLTLLISDAEQKILENKGLPPSLLHVMRFHYASSLKKTLPFQERFGFSFIGNFRHAPNEAAALRLFSLWPQIRRHLPEAKIFLYGAFISKKITQLHNPQTGFFVEGFCENAISALEKTRVLLAPLEFGAGIKGKLFDAFCSATPVMTTPIGAEGMHEGMAFPGEISELTSKEMDQDIWIQKAIALHQNPILWEEKSLQAKELLSALYDEGKLQKDFLDRLDQINAEKKSRSLFSAILWENQFQSTKYLSRWIELKNKAPSVID
jgi:hypothetical protein